MYSIVFTPILDLLSGKQVDKAKLAIYPFLILSLLLFCNINGLIFSIFKISSLVSPLIFISSISILSLIPIRTIDFNWGFLAFFNFFIIFLLFGWISNLVNFDTNHFTISSVIQSSREILTGVIIISTFYIFGNWMIKKGQANTLINFVFFFFIITMLAGIFESLLGLRDSFEANIDVGKRSLGFFGNPNETGYQANLTLLLSLYLYLRKRINVIFLLILMGLSFYAAFITFSKSAIISNVILMLIFFSHTLISIFLGNHRKRLSSLKFIFLFGLILFFGTKFIILPLMKDLKSGQIKRVEIVLELVVKGKFNNKTTSKRAGIFKDAIELIKKKPISGYGLSSFSIGGLFKSSPTHGVHNMYLKILGEAGIFAFLIFIFVLGFLSLFSLYKVQGPEGFLLLLYMILFSLYSFGSHNSFGDKFSIGLFGVILSITNIRNIKLNKIFNS